MAKPVLGRVGAEARFVDGRSFELQLDAPNAASNPSEITVHATRSGVQNFILFTFLSDITNTLLLDGVLIGNLLCGSWRTSAPSALSCHLRRELRDTQRTQRKLFQNKTLLYCF